jgi:eukaryotic-like serine/threonine-protein kinase
MGVVVSARHVQLGHLVAIKFLNRRAAQLQEATTRFLREARAAVGLHSAHVVRVMDAGTHSSGLPYMIMEHLSGMDLSALLEERGVLPIAEAVDYVLQACEALAEAHAAGIVHRDLKPGNLFLGRGADGAPLVKVLDFGISKAMEGNALVASEASLTATSSIMGSPLYMSPEQLRSSKNVDLRTDLWSLGVILYQLISGEPPFEADTVTGLCAMIVADAPPALRSRAPQVPEALDRVVMRCLDKDMTRRFQSVGELAVALRPFATADGQLSADKVARMAGLPSGSTSSGQFPASAESAPSLPKKNGATVKLTPGGDTISAWQSSDAAGRKRMTLFFAVGGAILAGIVGAVLALSLGRSREDARVAPAAQPSLSTPIAATAAPSPPLPALAPLTDTPPAPSGSSASAAPPPSTQLASNPRPAARPSPPVRPAPTKPPPAAGRGDDSNLLNDRK